MVCLLKYSLGFYLKPEERLLFFPVATASHLLLLALGVLICSRNLYYAPSKSAAFIYTLWIFLLNSSEFHKCDSSLIQLPGLPWLLLLLQKEIILLNVLILNRCSYLTSKSLCLICFSRFIFVSFFNITEYFNRF